jgi:hypothetical protein
VTGTPSVQHYPLDHETRADFKGFGFDLVTGIMPLEGLDETEVQSRHGEQLTAVVANYARAKKSGAIFPRIVTTEDGVVIRGKTTVAADRENGTRVVPSFIMKGVKWGNLSSQKKEELLYLDVMSNQRHGQAASESAIDMAIATAVHRGAKPRTVSIQLNIPIRDVNRRMSKAISNDRLTKLGFDNTREDGTARIGSSQLAELGRASAVTPSDEAFTALANLAADGELKVGQIKAVADDVRKSDQAALTVIESHRAQLAQQIQDVATNGSPRSISAFSRYNMTLGNLLSMRGSEGSVWYDVNLSPEARSHHLARLDAAMQTLAAIQSSLLGG